MDSEARREDVGRMFYLQEIGMWHFKTLCCISACVCSSTKCTECFTHEADWIKWNLECPISINALFTVKWGAHRMSDRYWTLDSSHCVCVVSHSAASCFTYCINVTLLPLLNFIELHELFKMYRVTSSEKWALSGSGCWTSSPSKACVCVFDRCAWVPYLKATPAMRHSTMTTRNLMTNLKIGTFGFLH